MKRLIFHLFFLVLLTLAYLPVANIFFRAKIPIGWDTSNFAHYILNFRENPAFPVSAWKMDEFEGMSRLVDSTWLHFYLIQPLVSIIGFFPAVKVYPLFFLWLFLVFSYLLFFEISQNMLIAFGLALLLSRTGAVFIPLYSSGVVLSSLSQTFYPLMMFFLVRFARTGLKNMLIFGGIALAMGMYTHPGTTTSMTLVSSILFLIFFSNKEYRLFDIWAKIKVAITFYLTAFFVGFLAIGPDAYVKIFEGGHQWLRTHIVPEEKTFSFFFSSLNPMIYVAIAAAVTLAGLLQKMNRMILPFAVILGYFFLFQWTLWLGINPLGGFMCPHRIYWVGIVAALSLISALVAKEPGKEWSGKTQNIYRVGIIILFVVLLSSLIQPLRSVFSYLDDPWYSGEDFPYVATDPKKDYGSYLLTMTGADRSFFDRDKNYRFYALDYGHNISYWMGMMMPEAKGVFAYSTGKNVDWFAWLDGAFSSESQEKGRLDPYVAEQQSQFLLDWYAIRYIFSIPKMPQELAPWLLDQNKPYIEAKIGREGNALVRVRSISISPILAQTSSTVIGFVGTKDGYDSFLRNLGVLNYNSQYIIPIQLAEHLEDVKERDFASLDGLFIYSYQQKNKEKHKESWQQVDQFVQNGGIVFVDTGSYAPEKYMTDALPDIFPIDRITSQDIGNTWNVSTRSDLLSSVDFSALSPLSYEHGDWMVDTANVAREGAKVDLAVSGKIIAASRQKGKGLFMWSGMNVPYRMHYFSKNAKMEITLLQAFLDHGFGVKREILPRFEATRLTSEKAMLTGNNVKGILFKENNYGGWRVMLYTENKSEKLPILSAGPDFMYVPLPKGTGEFRVEFAYVGKPENWFFLVVTSLSILYILDGIVLHHTLVNRLTFSLRNKWRLTLIKTKKWWEKEGE